MLNKENVTEVLKDVIYKDLEAMVGEEAMKKFDKKGWELD